MTAKQIKEQFKQEYDSIMPDFDKILANINSVQVTSQPVVEPVKKLKPQFANVWNRRSEVETKQPKLKLITAMMSLCVCVMLVAVSMFYCGVFSLDKDIVINLDKQADSYVSLNINPEFDFAVNKFNKITTAKGKNESSKLLLSQLYKTLNTDTLVGMELNGALIAVIDESAKMGYIDVESKGFSNAIMIDVMGTNTTACVDTKNLLANEANSYFADKGILAVVVTNYDSKAALVEEAKKANPNVSADASIGELISAVESSDGGKSMYEQEIERIKKENGDYSTFLDGDEISRAQFAASEKIYLYNDLIAKQNKIIANLEVIKKEYTKQIADKQIAVDSLQREKEYYLAEIDKINSNPENYGSAKICKDNLEKINSDLILARRDVEDLKMMLNNLDKEYENKLIALESSKLNLQSAIAQIETNKTVLSQEINNLNQEIDGYETKKVSILTNIETEQALLKKKYTELENAKIALDNEYLNYNKALNKMDIFKNLDIIVNAVNTMNEILLPKLQQDYNDKHNKAGASEKHNCVGSIPEFTAIKIVEKIANYSTFITEISYFYNNNVSLTVDGIIAKYYREIIFDSSIFDEEELLHNKENEKVGLDIIARIIKEHLQKYGINEDINEFISNIFAVDESIESLRFFNNKAEFSYEGFKQEYTSARISLDLSASNYESKCAKYNQIYFEIDYVKQTIKTYEENYAEINVLITSLSDEIDSIQLQILALNDEINIKKSELEAVNYNILNINKDKADRAYELKNQLEQRYSDLESLTNDQEKWSNQLNEAVQSNKKLAKEYSTLSNEKTVSIDAILSEVAVINLKINNSDAEILSVKNIINGYNQIVAELKVFRDNYKHGARIVSVDSEFEKSFNAEIANIEQTIAELRTASDKEMQDSIKSNLDKMAEAQLNKNIDKYKNHSSSMSQEELNNWQSEQQEFVNAQGWESIYKAWLASQIN